MVPAWCGLVAKASPHTSGHGSCPEWSGAWLGLVPKQISTGDRTILGKISKRGNRYLRVLFVQAAWSY